MFSMVKKLDLEEMMQEVREVVLASLWNFLIYVVLLQVTPFTLKKLDSIQRLGIRCTCMI
uniref:Uncharacterized protein n=1 Tax=Sciurus vulgaris TaxID=55149 RepID=A0A8D2D4Y1_SCIVU